MVRCNQTRELQDGLPEEIVHGAWSIGLLSERVERYLRCESAPLVGYSRGTWQTGPSGFSSRNGELESVQASLIAVC